jgi:DNA-binding LacI/PurR family transcriptional regulator
VKARAVRSSGVPTITQVAEAAGVSRATVSRAFGQPELLSDATVKLVREVADQLGYVPNQTARALSTGRAGNIALVVPDITNPFFAAIMRGAQALARQQGYATFLGDSDETPELEDLLLTRLAAQVDGFILVSSRLTRERIRAHAARRPLVLLNRDVSGIPRLLIDAASSYEAAVEHLAGLGHRAIAYVSGPAISWSNRQRRDAVSRAAERCGLLLFIVPTEKPTFEAGQRCTEAVLKTGATAALAFDDVTAQGLMSGLAARGLSVPGDMSVVGCDGVVATMTYPPLSSISIDCFGVGQTGVRMLLDVLGGERVREKSMLATELVLRATTAPPQGTAVLSPVKTAAGKARGENLSARKP